VLLELAHVATAHQEYAEHLGLVVGQSAVAAHPELTGDAGAAPGAPASGDDERRRTHRTLAWRSVQVVAETRAHAVTTEAEPMRTVMSKT